MMRYDIIKHSKASTQNAITIWHKIAEHIRTSCDRRTFEGRVMSKSDSDSVALLDSIKY